jgi:MFS transporter, DHA2 family, multidrug resistance protein
MIVSLTIVAAVTLSALVWHLLVTEEPIVDLRVFKERSYAVGVFLMTVVGFVLYGSMVLLPIMLQTVLGYPPLQAGIAMAPRGIGSFFMMPITGLMTGKFDARKLLTAGLLLGGTTLIWLSWLNLQAGYWDIFWPQLLQGVGMSLLFVPLTTISMDAIPREKMGNATSLFNLMRNIGASIGIAMVTTIVARHTQININVLGAGVSNTNAAAGRMTSAAKAWFMSHGMDVTTATQMSRGALWGEVQRQATMVSFIHAFRFLAIMFLVILPLILIMRPPSHKGGGGAAMH